MIINCEKCSSSFNLKDSLVKPAGSKVRCSKCKHIFIVYPSEDAPEPEMKSIEPDVQDQPAASENGISFEYAEQETADRDLEATGKPPADDLDLEMAFETLADQETEDEEDKLNLEFDDDIDKIEPDLEDEKAGQPEDELDFSDLGKMFDDEDGDTGAKDAEDDSELNLTLEDDDKTEDELDFSGIGDIIDKEVASSGMESEDTDMDLDLSLADEDKMFSDNAPDEDLDFSELEKMLEEDDFESDDHSEENLELDLDLELAPEEASDDDLALEMGTSEGEDEDMDFSDIEEMLESDEDEVNEDEPELVMEPKQTGSGDEDFEFTLEEDQPESEDAEEDHIEEDEDMEINLDAEDESELDMDVEVEVADDESLDSEDLDQDEIEAQEEEPAIKPPPPAKKKKTSPALIILLILVMICGGGYAALTLLNIDISKLPDMLTGNTAETGIKDPGNLKITTHDVRSKFIENRKSGRIFVITGSVTNEYSAPRSFISIIGKLYAKEKSLAKTENVFAGNFLSDIDLTQMNIESISSRLKTRNGDNNINIQVKPQDSIPFMIVFSELPEDLAEFTIEVTSSISG
ncbi:MAG: zinc-ribbon domain-containing protein [Proteobacteria bacterium]|nr:zinc-ribbon domain-containing protein [Pseudomonadota bacterium]